jgi:flavin-binding protein dodecin
MSVYKVIELVGTSEKSWEEAASEAVKTAGKHIRDIRVAEVIKVDMHIDEEGSLLYRTRLSVSFKYHGE